MFYAGDDAEAKQIAHQLAADIGFTPQAAGSLKQAISLEGLHLFGDH